MKATIYMTPVDKESMKAPINAAIQDLWAKQTALMDLHQVSIKGALPVSARAELRALEDLESQLCDLALGIDSMASDIQTKLLVVHSLTKHLDTEPA